MCDVHKGVTYVRAHAQLFALQHTAANLLRHLGAWSYNRDRQEYMRDNRWQHWGTTLKTFD